ncbi:MULTISPECIES: FHA domain-containing protein [unclassified Lysobacter]|uniref:FHA domain-containing protein n=1 Tax=unclassified Lysobacter TaxID=2635362 RepID=UPI000701A176|nr:MULTISPECIES: FHA domain-containing protein [unclassified Lysobacter]KRA15317.1 hypothetical protein ASD69_17740 [Lysobacter sp. Root604]KRD30385.1 hypothetical protein ASE35_16765 [Lysobacter sp. Root916]KRD80391.1 hypothetical protein ASE43_05930 [Lysobacter sp. Root983]
MKLVFPDGEHPQVLLGHGVNRVGSDPESTIVLDRPGVMPQHCQLHVSAQGVMLDVPPGAQVRVNGRQVAAGLIALRPGDDVSFDEVRARLAAIGPSAVRHQGGVAVVLPPSANDDPGVTAVRPVLPRYVLRGVSGDLFGRSFPLLAATVVGRSADCGLQLDQPGLSRQHARLIPTHDGLQIEDLGSTNGTSINGRRVLRAIAQTGDEIGFDQLRFRLTGSLQEAPAGEGAAASAPTTTPLKLSRPTWHWAALAGVTLLALVGFVLLR